MCNECGNCTTFCPYASEPCKDKFTLFHTEEDFLDSENAGFLMQADSLVKVRLGDQTKVYDLSDPQNGLHPDLETLIVAVLTRYSYLLK